MKTNKFSPRLNLLSAGLIAAMALAAGTANANLLFSGSGTNTNVSPSTTLSASALFQVNNAGLLTITLTNTGPDSMVPSDLLSAVFFDITGNPTLTSPTANIASSSSAIQVSQSPNPNVVTTIRTSGADVRDQFAYGGALTGAPGGRDYGFSSSGFSSVGWSVDPINPPPTTADGMDYNISSVNDVPTTGNPALKGNNANPGAILIKSSVVFTLAGFPVTPDLQTALNAIHNVWFQYGTNLAEPGFISGPPTNPDQPTVPIPFAAWFVAPALAGLLGFGRKKAQDTSLAA